MCGDTALDCERINERLTISEAEIDSIYSFKDRKNAENNIVELDTTYIP